MRTALKLAGGLAALVLSAGCEPIADPADDVAVQAPVQQVPTAAATVAREPDPEPPAAAPPPRETAAELLQAASGGDGDSWRDTTGREYRLGMVDTPEVGACFSREATAERTSLVAAGFLADVYTTDRYGREVSVVTTPDGTNVNVHLARHGFADDRYLAQFRHENPALAAQLDAAFAAAQAERAGLWGACRGSTQVQGLVAPPAAAPAPAAPAGAPPRHPSPRRLQPRPGATPTTPPASRSRATAPAAATRTTSTAARSGRPCSSAGPAWTRTASMPTATASAATARFCARRVELENRSRPVRLILLDPPALVSVVDAAGTSPALLVAVRGERRYVQVSRGPGLNHLRWVDARSVAPAADPLLPQADPPAHPSTGLPWIRGRSTR